MPKIPTFQSQQSLTSQAPNTRIDTSKVGFGARALQQSAKTIEAAAQRFKDMHDLSQFTEASTTANRRLNDLRVQLDQDDDIFSVPEKFSKEAQRIRDDALSNISSNDVRLRLQTKLDTAIASADFDVRRMARSKQIDQAQFNLNDHIDSSTDMIVRATNRLERQRLTDSVINSIDDHVKVGVINPNDGKKLKDAFVKNVTEKQVEYDIDLSPALARRNIVEGVYELDAEQQDKYLGLADRLEEKRNLQDEKAFKQFQTQNAIDMTVKMWNEELTIEDVETAVKSGQITLTTAEKLQKALISKDTIDPKVKPDKFNQLQTEFITLDIDPKSPATSVSIDRVQRFIVSVNSAWGNGEIDTDDAQRWVRYANASINQKIEDIAIEEVMKSKNKGWFQSLDKWAEENADDIAETKMRLYREFYKNVEGGKTGEDALDSAIIGEQKRKNPNRSLYKIGDVIPTPAGSVKVVGFYPDGEPEVEIIK